MKKRLSERLVRKLSEIQFSRRSHAIVCLNLSFRKNPRYAINNCGIILSYHRREKLSRKSTSQNLYRFRDVLLNNFVEYPEEREQHLFVIYMPFLSLPLSFSSIT